YGIRYRRIAGDLGRDRLQKRRDVADVKDENVVVVRATHLPVSRQQPTGVIELVIVGRCYDVPVEWPLHLGTACGVAGGSPAARTVLTLDAADLGSSPGDVGSRASESSAGGRFGRVTKICSLFYQPSRRHSTRLK